MSALSPWSALQALHFLRPWWFLALAALPLLVWHAHRQARRHSVWQRLVDPHLLPHLLESRTGRRRSWGLWLAGLGYAGAVIALAGPSWRQVSQPLWQNRAPLMIALDLSSASQAGDLPPTRLAQARAKLAALLRERSGAQVGLVVFAGDAFTVAPLTDDAANVALFLDALQPDVMPVDGQRLDRAIAWSSRLLTRAQAQQAQILVLTDHADARARDAARDAASNGYRVSALGLGSAEGGAYRRADGSIGQARLDAASLRALARAGGGRYATIGAGDADLRALGLLSASGDSASAGSTAGRAWQDEGYWLLPPLLLLALLAFRRRSGVGLLLVLLVALPTPSVHAAGLWRRTDQQQYAQLREADAAYRRGDFAEASRLFGAVDTPNAHYNRGNALAKQGQYPQALQEYDVALRQSPDLEDARYNKRAVEEAMRRQKQQSSGSKQGKPQQGGQGGQQPSPSPSQKQPGSGQPDNSNQDASGQQQAPRPPDPQATPSQPDQGSAPEQARPGDVKAQEQADQAQRERMQQALRQATGNAQDTRPTPQRAETAEQRERRLANEAWLKRVPDDPGGLLRTKFRLEYERRRSQGGPEE